MVQQDGRAHVQKLSGNQITGVHLVKYYSVLLSFIKMC